MTRPTPLEIPPPSPAVFSNGISHPDLWLWDSWVLDCGQELHLYCLALNRMARDGTPILPKDRNDHFFHIRHFVSNNKGQTWKDGGAITSPGQNPKGFDGHNLWSGSAIEADSGTFLFFFTGVHKERANCPFVQSLHVSITKHPDQILSGHSALLSSSTHDYDNIVESGYYLGPRNQLGRETGEEGGPILAWRDPFAFKAPGGGVHLFAAAKVGAKVPAIAHAKLKVIQGSVEIETLFPPLRLPDSDLYTQAEVPKVYYDEKRDLYYMLISACDRLFEGQPDSEVQKQHRLYKSTSLSGPWAPYHKAGSLLPGLQGLFGASLISANFDTGEFAFIAPYTEMAPKHLQLTFAPVRYVNIYKDPAKIEMGFG